MTDTRTAAEPNVRRLPIAAGGELELRLGANRLRVLVTDGDQVVIRGRTDHDLERDVEITSGTGWIRVSDGPVGSLRLGPLTVRGGGHAPDLDVEVPRNVRVSARTLSGDIEAFGIAGSSRWQSASGDVHLTVVGGQVSIDTVSGDATVDAREPIAVSARTVSGTVRIRAPRLRTLDTATTSGNVTVDAALEAGGHHSIASVSGDVRLSTGSEVTVELQSVAGDIRASMPHHTEGSRGRRTIVVGSGRVRMSVRTMSGDVQLLPGAPDTGPAAAAPSASAGADSADVSVASGPAGPDASWAAAGTAWTEAANGWASSGAATDGQPAWGSPATRDAKISPIAPVEPAASAPSQEVAAPSPDAASSIDDTAPVPVATHVELEAARLEVLRALERGDLDVEAAAARLAAIEDTVRAPGA